MSNEDTCKIILYLRGAYPMYNSVFYNKKIVMGWIACLKELEFKRCVECIRYCIENKEFFPTTYEIMELYCDVDRNYPYMNKQETYEMLNNFYGEFIKKYNGRKIRR